MTDIKAELRRLVEFQAVVRRNPEARLEVDGDEFDFAAVLQRLEELERFNETHLRAQDRLTKRMLELESENQRLHEDYQIMNSRIVEQDDEIRRLREYKMMYCHARDCVDKVFQKCKSVPDPILPDYCGWGEDKFRAVVRLAEDYRDLTETD